MASHQEASSSNSSNSNSTRKTYKYDIFLSFRGKDTRTGFTDHLYHGLTRKGFKVFRDEEDLDRGEIISDELLQAIKDSKFAIVVLSKNYASSSWCLNELQHIFFSRSNPGEQVFPIFYDVDPSDVRHQTGSFYEAFSRHQMLDRNPKDMERWRDSLTKVANLSGWDSKYWHEAKLIDAVAEKLWTKLHSRLPHYSEELIGIVNKVEKLEPLLEMGLNDVRFVGIWGSPGVGKTTIARAVYEKYRSQFHHSCFLNVKRTSLEGDGEVELQSKLLSRLKIGSSEIEDKYEGRKIIQNFFRNKKVLLILDDVSHTSHLENLAKSPSWFGSGSRVIITTRNLALLRIGHQINVHQVEIMNSDESFQLFCQKAFGKDDPPDDLLELSKTVCAYAQGLPLALSVLGSFFGQRNRSVSEWKDALDMLKKNPSEDILKILEISFDALTDMEQAIFLDISCFFNGWSKKLTIQILESCGFNAKIGITLLHEKCLLKDYDSFLVMHDLLEQMGRKIVEKSAKDIGNRSRLWSTEDIDGVMENKLGTKEIEGMVSSTSCEACWHPEAFSTLHNLRLLMVSSSDDFNLPHGLKCLSPALKVLHWTKYPLGTLPSRTRLLKLVDLRMCHSKLRKLWNKTLCSENLKFLDLSYSQKLIGTPDFSKLPNLERLELEGCEGLADLHASIGQHKKLQVLNLKGCKNLRAHCLKKLEMTALKEFVLCGCIQVKLLPEFGESMRNLETLDAGETNLVKLPESLGLLTSLKTLKLRGCKNLVCLPESIHNLKCLKVIDIASCSKFSALPDKLNEIEALEVLDSSETGITEVPSSIGGLKNVKKLSFHGCKRSTSNSWSLILPVNHMFWGHSIHKGLTLPASMFSMKSVTKLDLSYCNIDDGSIPIDFDGLLSLEKFDLSGNKLKNPPAGCFSKLLNLQYLCLNSCSELQSLPQPPPSLREMDAGECGSLEPVTGEQLLHHLFAFIDQVKRLKGNETLSVTVPGSEIPLWFENQNDLCVDGMGSARMMIDIPPCEEMLGIGLCILVDHKFYSTDPSKPQLLWPIWLFDFAVIPPPNPFQLVGVPGTHREFKKEIKSSHLWIVFWKQEEELSHRLQLWKYSQIPLTLTRIGKADAKVSIKCGWRVIRKSDFENSGSSMSQSLLPTLEQQQD